MKALFTSLFLLLSLGVLQAPQAQSSLPPAVPWLENIGSGAWESETGRYLSTLRDGRLYSAAAGLGLAWSETYASPKLLVGRSPGSDYSFAAIFDGKRIDLATDIYKWDPSSTALPPSLTTGQASTGKYLVTQSTLTGNIYASAYTSFNTVSGPGITPLLAGAIFYRQEDNLTVQRLITATEGELYYPTGQLVLGQKNGMDVVYGMDTRPYGMGTSYAQPLSRVYAVENANDPGKAVLHVLYEFGPDDSGNAVSPNAMLLGSDGWLYGLVAYWRGFAFASGTRTVPGTPTGLLFRLHPERPGSYEVLHTFTIEEGELTYDRHGRVGDAVEEVIGQGSNNKFLSWLVEGPDGKIYGNLGWADCHYAVRRKDQAHLPGKNQWGSRSRCKFNDTSSSSSELLKEDDRALYVEDSPPLSMQYPHHDVLVDGKPYYGALYRMDKDGGNFQILHRFDNETGAHPIGPMVMADDGNIYGTTLMGGAPWERFFKWEWPQDIKNPIITDYPHRPEGAQYRDGVLYRIVPGNIRQNADGSIADGGFERLVTFRNCCDYAENTVGGFPVGVTKGNDGSLYLTVQGGPWRRVDPLPDPRLGGYGAGLGYASTLGTQPRLKVNFSGAPTGALITVTLSPSRVVLGETTTIAWEGKQVRNCVGRGGYDDEAWLTTHQPYGELTLTPPKSEGGKAYTFYMECEATDGANADGSPKKVVSNYAQLYVNLSGMEIVADDRDYGNGGGALGWLALMLGAGVAAGRRRAAVAVRGKGQA